jgi:YVTN family beta-propeller protein
VIDTATDKVVDTITVDKNTIGPFRARFSQDGNTLVTVNSSNALANIIDMRTKVQKTVSVGPQAFGIAFSADGKTVLVSNHGDGTISVIDLAESKLVDTLKAGTGIETLSFY